MLSSSFVFGQIIQILHWENNFRSSCSRASAILANSSGRRPLDVEQNNVKETLVAVEVSFDAGC